MSHALTYRRRTLKAASAVDLGVLYSTVSAGMLLVRRYLTGRGVDQAFADRYGSAFGRTAAKIYRTGHGVEPRKAWSNVSGKWRRVNGYLPTETDVLDEAFTTYKRTAEYVATAPAAAPSAVETSTEDAPRREACRIPGCDGAWHYDGTCVAALGELAFDDSGVLPVELVEDEDGTREIVAFAFGLNPFNLRRGMRDHASALAFANQMRTLADAVDAAATHLPAA